MEKVQKRAAVSPFLGHSSHQHAKIATQCINQATVQARLTTRHKILIALSNEYKAAKATQQQESKFFAQIFRAKLKRKNDN